MPRPRKRLDYQIHHAAFHVDFLLGGFAGKVFLEFGVGEGGGEDGGFVGVVGDRDAAFELAVDLDGDLQGGADEFGGIVGGPAELADGDDGGDES